MISPYRGAYFVMGLILLVIWLLLFIRRKDLRKEMLVMGSLVTATLGIFGIPFLNLYLKDYWSPEYLGILKLDWFFDLLGLSIRGTEDVLFVFTLSGIGAVLYEEILGKRHLKKGRKTSLKIFLAFPLIMVLSWGLVSYFNVVNIIYADFIGYALTALLIWYFRRDLILHSILSGVFLGAFFFLFYYLLYLRIYPGIIENWWILSKTSGLFFAGVPIEEILWAFFLGLWVGPLYELLTNLKDK